MRFCIYFDWQNITLGSVIDSLKIFTFTFNCHIVSSHNFQSCSWVSRIERCSSSVSWTSSHVDCLYCYVICFHSFSSFSGLFCSFISFKILSEVLLFNSAFVVSHLKIFCDFLLKYVSFFHYSFCFSTVA